MCTWRYRDVLHEPSQSFVISHGYCTKMCAIMMDEDNLEHFSPDEIIAIISSHRDFSGDIVNLRQKVETLFRKAGLSPHAIKGG